MLCCDEATIESSLNGVPGSSTTRPNPLEWTPLTTWAEGSESEAMFDRDEQCNHFSGNQKRRFDSGGPVVVLSEMSVESQLRNVSGTVCKLPPVGAAGWCWLVLRNRTGTRHSDFLCVGGRQGQVGF